MHHEQPNQSQHLPNDHAEAPTASAPQEPEMSKRQSRRRLLKAATAVPVIYTLPIGASVAASSTCIDKEDNFKPLTDEQKQDFADGKLSRGQELDHNYVVFDGNDKVKGSCWCSINPTDTNCSPI
ncbi:hypothetical protein [Halochromatium glycolicum]|jgi:hypothetical protein|uniref:Uncharacterized protein n=1 Tax=Halochromatium glycolicum TaxID=85075 RepID=A0AAJ0U4G4_9GAMM|nr:hypothetical protein [Halochromatium glycolicum]MBK1704665.1 hypothetical protein [Halochromatium glycolicum]